MQSFNMGRVPPITFGAGRLSRVADVVAGLGGGPVLVVADAALVGFGVVDRLTDVLKAADIPVSVAADVAGEPKEALIDGLCARAREEGSRCVIGLGGGAALDTSKLVATLAQSGEPATNFALAAKPFPKETLPSIAIPTTAGTGSEVTRISVVSAEDGRKFPYYGDALLFDHAVLDPELTLSLPPHLTAWTGIDAVAHALEGATVRKLTPVGRMSGLEALRLLAEALPRAVADGSDIDARSQVLWGSMVAGIALNNCSVHIGHNISHALGSVARVHHGHATGLGLDVSLPVLAARPEGADAYAQAAQALGGPAEAAALPEVYSALMRKIGIAAELPAQCAEVTVDALAAEMKAAANIGMAKNAPCRLSSEDLDDLAGRVMQLPVAAA